MVNFELNNSTGTGSDAYAYYSKFVKFNPEKAFGFQDAKRTFELWKMNKARVYIQPGYNNYNQTYNTVNLDAALSSTVWVASDYGINENVSGVDLMSYQNARFHSLSLNSYKKIVDTTVRLNQTAGSPIMIMPASTWLDTSIDMANVEYSGFQIFTMMPGIVATNYLPKYQMIVECDVEFKQPAWQNISTSFEKDSIGATLLCTINAAGDTLEFTLATVKRDATGTSIRFLRTDGLPGTLTYSAQDFYQVYVTGKNVGYYNDDTAVYTGPIPPKE
jgi:hypothetical protein